MVICQSCGSERGELDRFCRACGVPAMASVTELEDTRRFNPAASAQGAPSGVTSQLYAPPAVAYSAIPPETNSLYKTASLRKKVLKRKGFWFFLLVLISVFTMAGMAIGVKMSNSRRNAAENRIRRVSTEDVPNAFGFRPGLISDAGYPQDIKGIYVESLVTDDGPAALANIQAGDVLMTLGGKPVRNISELRYALDSLLPGQTVPADVYREGDNVKLQIKIADRNYAPLQPRLEMREQGWFGADHITRRCGVPGAQKCGVEIQGVRENSPADLGNLREGDVITEFNGFKVRTADELKRRVRLAKPRSKVVVTFYRGNAEHQADVIIGYLR
ncbi:MAG: PDZ domain-containing protein [Acidobacteriota bacterium]|nr:PDZ domain-containing protein [Acidobacteriota bacterium]